MVGRRERIGREGVNNTQEVQCNQVHSQVGSVDQHHILGHAVSRTHSASQAGHLYTALVYMYMYSRYNNTYNDIQVHARVHAWPGTCHFS